MNKLLLLVIFCLGISHAVHAKKASKECYVSIYAPAPPIQCDTVIVNGKEEVECSQVGPAEALIILNSKSRTASIDTEIDEFDYSGNCQCSFKLWSKPGFKGATKTYTSTKRSNDIVISDIWSRAAKSFRVTCRF